MNQTPFISIIVPVLNEATQMSALLQHLQQWQNLGCEIIVVDGGSSDTSLTLLEKSAFTILHSERGRARQMNTGAQFAQGDILLFLHADTHLPANASTLVLSTFASEKNHWGRFDVRIEGNNASSFQDLMFKIISAFINVRSRLSGIATGDQAIFVKRSTFESIGGFVEQPLMEDVELSKQLKKFSRPICLTEKVITSARRWQGKGVWRTIWLMWRLRFDYWRGIPAEVLVKHY